MNILTANLLFSTLVFWIAAKIYVLPRLKELKPRVVLLPILLLSRITSHSWFYGTTGMRPIGNTKPSLRPGSNAVACACTCQNHGNGGRRLHMSCTRFFRRCALTFNGNFELFSIESIL